MLGEARRALDLAHEEGDPQKQLDHLWRAVAGLAAAVEDVGRWRSRGWHVGPLYCGTATRLESDGQRREFVIFWRDFRRTLVRVPLPGDVG